MADLLDYYLRRRIFLGRWSAQEAKAIIALLEDLNKDLVDLALKGVEPERFDQLDVLLIQSEALHKQLTQELTALAENKMRELTEAEIASQQALFESLAIGFDQLNPSAVFAAANAEPFRGRFLGEWFESLTERQQQKVSDTLRIGYLDGRNKYEIITDLTRIFPATYNDAEAIMRTATTHYASVAQEEIMRSAGIDRYVWYSTLDTRTTPICQARDGKVYRMSANDPMPPAHFRCRSVVSPLVKGLEPAERPTYGKWIKQQPHYVQDDILGPARAELLRQGVGVDRFVDDATGRTFTLAELAKRESEAWVKAGLGSSEPEPEPIAFKYESFVPVKTREEAAQFVVDNGIASRCEFRQRHGLRGLQDPLQAMQEVTERFDLKPLAFTGHINDVLQKQRETEDCNAAIYPGVMRVQDDGRTYRGVFHTPNHFGSKKRAAESNAVGTRYASEYKRIAQESLRAIGASDDVMSRFNRLKDGEFSWSMSSLAGADNAYKTTTYHEYGHVLHVLDERIGPEINDFLSREKPRDNGWQHLLSKYSDHDDREYVAESFAVYMSLPEDQHYRVHPELLDIFKKWDRKK